MTDPKITPPPELVQQWIGDYYGCPVSGELAGVETAIAARAAQWGADCELNACCEWVKKVAIVQIAENLRAARRPKPPSLKELALQKLAWLEDENGGDQATFDTIRRALEALPE
jgi:hypothetical protein